MIQVNWKDFRGQKFTEEEAWQAQDFQDKVMAYELPIEDFEFLWREDDINFGTRMYLVENMDVSSLGMVLMRFDLDERLKAIAQDRLKKERDKIVIAI